MIEGKVIIVTGGASGIGRASSLMFAADGAKVLVVDRCDEAGHAVVEDIAKAGGTARYHSTDVSIESDVQAMVDAAVTHFGRLDGAFNNAGVPMCTKLTSELSSAEYDRVVGINQRGTFLCMKYEIAAMQKTGRGAIVNTSSSYGVVATPSSSDYVSSKHGVVGLVRAASTETRFTGVRVNGVLPGVIETPLVRSLLDSPDFQRTQQMEASKERHSIGRFGQPEDVAKAVKWLLSDESDFVNGVLLPVDGGFLAR